MRGHIGTMNTDRAQPRLKPTLRQLYREGEASPWLKTRVLAEINTGGSRPKPWGRYAGGVALVAVVLVCVQLLQLEDTRVERKPVSSTGFRIGTTSLSVSSVSAGSIKVPGISTLAGVPAPGRFNTPAPSNYSRIDFCLYPRRGEKTC